MNSLIDAYKKTKFQVKELSLTIEIGKLNDKLDYLLQKHNTKEWAFITAFNPFSKVLNKQDNIFRHEELKELTLKYITFEGYGVGEDPKWEPELSLLIIGISKNDAITLGNKFEQNAIVNGELNQAPELLILNQALF
jgi:hypothetical protein